MVGGLECKSSDDSLRRRFCVHKSQLIYFQATPRPLHRSGKGVRTRKGGQAPSSVPRCFGHPHRPPAHGPPCLLLRLLHGERKRRRSRSVSDCLSFWHGIYSSRPKDLRADSPKAKASSLSSAEVRRLWEEPRDSRKTRGDTVGIPAIHGREDVKVLVSSAHSPFRDPTPPIRLP